MHQNAMDLVANITKVKCRGISSVSQPCFEESRAMCILFLTKQGKIVSETAGGHLKCTPGNTKLSCKLLSRSCLFEDTIYPKLKWNKKYIRGMCSHGKYWPFMNFLWSESSKTIKS